MNDYLIGKKEMGIFRIYNLKTDKQRFMLDLGAHPNHELQKDYTATGLELFVIDLVSKCEKEDMLNALLEETIKAFTDKGITLYQA